LCLKNLHLVVEWLPELERAINGHREKATAGFQLWLTSEPQINFSKWGATILEDSLKIAYEPPPGVKQTMKRTYSQFGDDYLKNIQNSKQQKHRSQFLFLLIWFHALIQERRSFCPQGWKKPYDFSYGDLRAGLLILDNFAKDKDWEAIHGLMMDFVYGGHVDDVFDRNVLKVYLKKYFCDDVLCGHRELQHGVRIPNKTDVQDHHKTIATIPDLDRPIMFGLPENITRSIERTQCQRLLNHIKKLEAEQLSDTVFDKNTWQVSVIPVLQFWFKLVQSNALPELDSQQQHSNQDRHDALHCSEQTEDHGQVIPSNNPLKTFLNKELETGQKLYAMVNGAMVLIKCAISRNENICKSIVLLGNSFVRGIVPDQWRKEWDGPEALNAWIHGLITRYNRLYHWTTSPGSNQNPIPRPINLSHLFNPKAIFSSLQHHTARLKQCPIHELKMRCSCDDASMPHDESSIVIEGLLIQGAIYSENNVLKEMTDNENELSSVPPLSISFVLENKAQESRVGLNSHAIPVYCSLAREKALGEFILPCSIEEGEKWTLAGVALFLDER